MKPCTSRAAYGRKFTQTPKLPYLVTYTINCGAAEPCASLMCMQEIANLVGLRDWNESGNYHVYRLSTSGVPEPLQVWDHRGLMIELCDLSGNFVDSATYDDH